LRLIMPIRQGYLDGNSPKQLLQSDELVAQSLEDAATLARNHLPTPLTVLGNSYGGSMAVRFAAAYPDVVSSLVILSINAGLKGRTKGFTFPLYEGLQTLSNKPGIIRLMTWRFRQFYAERKTAHGVLSQMFSASGSDMKVVDRLLLSEPSAEWFSQLFQTSVNGIAEDFRFAGEEWQTDLADLKMPITFVHGKEDPIISVERLQALVDSSNQFDIKLIAGGHLICASHPTLVWQAVAQSVQAVETTNC
jgi:pimeloyl-ACP methyl ester carboxylesterase